MILGNFQFNLKSLSPNSLTRTTEYNWTNAERVGALPFLQNLGISSDTIEIEGVFYPKINAAKQYNSITKLAEDTAFKFLKKQLGINEKTESYNSINDIRNSTLCTTANNLITDNGEIIGKFVIVSITEVQSYFDKKGEPQKIEFTLSLKRSPEETTTFAATSTSTVANTLTNLSRNYLKW